MGKFPTFCLSCGTENRNLSVTTYLLACPVKCDKTTDLVNLLVHRLL